MKIEKLLQTYLALRLVSYADPELAGGPSEAWNQEVQKKGLTYDDFKWLISQEEYDKLTPTQKDAVWKVLDELKKTEDLLKGVLDGKTIVWKRTDILNKVYKIGDPKDKEFAEIVQRIESLWKELSTLDEAGKKLAEKVWRLKDLIHQEARGWMDDARKKLNETIAKTLWIKDMSEIKDGANLTITTSHLTPEQKNLLSLGKLLPPEILEVQIDGKKYTRANGSKLWEFLDTDNNPLVLKEGMKMSIGKSRSKEQVQTLDTQIREWLEGKEMREKIALELIRKYWLDEKLALPQLLENIWPADEDNEEERKEFENPEKVRTQMEKYVHDNFLKKEYYPVDKLLAEAENIQDPEAKQRRVEQIMAPRMDAAIKSNPADWVNRSMPKQEVPDLFKKILWFDFLKEAGVNIDNPHEAIAAQVGWVDSTRLGWLSERFESAGKGPEAINGDDNWLPSFGTYQLRADFLRDFAKKNGINGDHTQKWKDSEFAKNWLAKVKEMGADKFKEAEHAFIEETHYKPQLAKVKAAWVADADKFSMIMKNVIWSCAVQHWPGNTVITEAIAAIGAQNIKPGNSESELKLAQKVYEIRGWKFPKEKGRYTSELQIVTLNLKNVYGGGSIDGKEISSLPMKLSASGTTLCSQTARLNAAKYGLSLPSGDAEAVRQSYGARLNTNSTSLFTPDKKFVDLFSWSSKYPQYWHRALAINTGKGWVVLDPYLRIWWRARREDPIPLQTYMSFLQSSGRWFKGWAAYS